MGEYCVGTSVSGQYIILISAKSGAALKLGRLPLAWQKVIAVYGFMSNVICRTSA